MSIIKLKPTRLYYNAMKRKRSDSGGTASEETGPTEPVSTVSFLDGHYHGNFHNYYFFNPIEERMKLITPEFFSWATSIPLAQATKTSEGPKLLDVGCNSGDLSIGLFDACVSAGYTKSSLLGLDIDSKLVRDARKRVGGRKSVRFECCNVVEDSALLSGMFDISSVFGLTMWIHLHNGDAGLKEFVKKIASKTTCCILIEIHPWKCYKKALKRLRQRSKKMQKREEAGDGGNGRTPPLHFFPKWESIAYRRSDKLVNFVHNILTVDLGFSEHRNLGTTKWGREIRAYKRKPLHDE